MRITIATIVATLIGGSLLTACTSEPTAGDSSKTAENQCRLYRGYLGTQAYSDVMASCSRQLGEAYCRQCLGQ